MNVHCGTVYNSKDLEPTQMPITDRLDKENVEYYTAIKESKVTSFAATLMDLEIIVLCGLT